MNREELVMRATQAAYPELYDPENRAWWTRPSSERAHYQTEIMARIGRAVDVIQAASPQREEDDNVLQINLVIPEEARVPVASIGIASFLREDGTEDYSLGHSEGASRASLLGMLTMATYEICKAPGRPGLEEA